MVWIGFIWLRLGSVTDFFECRKETSVSVKPGMLLNSMTVSLNIPALWHMTPCKLMYRKHLFKEVCCVRFQGRLLGCQNVVGLMDLVVLESSF